MSKLEDSCGLDGLSKCGWNRFERIRKGWRLKLDCNCLETYGTAGVYTSEAKPAGKAQNWTFHQTFLSKSLVNHGSNMECHTAPPKTKLIFPPSGFSLSTCSANPKLFSSAQLCGGPCMGKCDAVPSGSSLCAVRMRRVQTSEGSLSFEAGPLDGASVNRKLAPPAFSRSVLAPSSKARSP